VKTLETEFSFKGFNYRQISRDGDVAVYEQRWGRNGSVAYETIIVQSHNGREIAGKQIPPSEFFPSTSSWGVKGWSFTDRELALAKANALTQDRKSAVLPRKPDQDDS